MLAASQRWGSNLSGKILCLRNCAASSQFSELFFLFVVENRARRPADRLTGLIEPGLPGFGSQRWVLPERTYLAIMFFVNRFESPALLFR